MTADDWWDTVAHVSPALPSYASTWRIAWNESKFEQSISERDRAGVQTELHRLWSELPDSPEIRRGPFFDVCDLLSESWVLEED